jgi:hypothetical protein
MTRSLTEHLCMNFTYEKTLRPGSLPISARCVDADAGLQKTAWQHMHGNLDVAFGRNYVRRGKLNSWLPPLPSL